MKKMTQGFTLVEIMIVVAIIAILAAVAIPNFIKYRNESQAASCIANMKQLKTAAESWAAKPTNSGVPTVDKLIGSTSDAYIKATSLLCPKDKTSAYTIATDEAGAMKVTCGSGDTEHVLR